MITNIAKILGMNLVFEINFSRLIFDIAKLKINNVKAKPIE